MRLSEATSVFLDYVRSYCSPDTVKYYEINMDLFQRFICNQYQGDIDLMMLHKIDFVNYVSFLRSKQIRNTSVRTYSRAVKVFLRFLYFEGYLQENIADHVRYPRPDARQIIPLSSGRVEKLLDAMKRSPCCSRNVLIFRLMLDCGLRCGEVARLDVCDIDLVNRFICVRNSKNNKNRIVPLPQVVHDCLIEYAGDALKIPFNADCLLKNSSCSGRITTNAIKQMFNKLKKYDPDIHAHLLRHTFATSFILGGGSLEVLRVLMGHEDYSITKNYLHIAQQLGVTDYDIYRLPPEVFRSYCSYDGRG